MAKTPPKSGLVWTSSEVKKLNVLAKHADKGHRFKDGQNTAAVASKASSIGLSLKLTNQSSYNRRKH